MKIAFCAYDQPDYVNGPNVWLCRLCGELLARGESPRVLLLAHREAGPTSEALAGLGVEVERVARPRYTEERVRWIVERLAASPPDVFVPNLAVAAYYAGAWARAAGIPTLGVLHSDDAFHWGLVDEFVRGPEPFRVSAVVVVSRFLEDEVRRLAPDSVRVARIPYGVPASERVAAWSGSSFRIAYAGRLVQPQKRVLDVAAALVRASSELTGVEGVLFGEGKERAPLEATLRGNAAVRLGGRIPNAEMMSTLAGFQALALLSDYEGLPISLLEAMAVGVVPICLRTRSGVDELVEDGRSGLLVEDRGDGFVAAVRRLSTDPALWERLSRGARERVIGSHSVAANADAWLDLCAALAVPPGDTPISVPRHPSLPPVHPALAREDERDPGLLRRFWRSGRRRLGNRWRRLIRTERT